MINTITSAGFVFDMYSDKAVDTDDAVIYFKETEYMTHFDDDNKILHRGWQATPPKLHTTYLSACMGVYIVAKEAAIALHVSPTQASNAAWRKGRTYHHISKALLKKGTEISVLVGGHTENFDEGIFREKTNEMGLVIKEIKKSRGSHSSGFVVSFDMERDEMIVTSFGAPENDPNKYEILKVFS